MGVGVGIMLTASVNLVQSAWPEEVQGDISGVSRSVSNLGSSLGVAIAGSIVAGASGTLGKPFAVAIVVLGVFAIVGWIAALLIPGTSASRPESGADAGATPLPRPRGADPSLRGDPPVASPS
jgi:MFS family permease